MEEAKQKVRLDVWSSYLSLKAATKNLSNNSDLLDISKHSYIAAEHRYAMGVGGILELLNTQGSLFTAKRQKLQALMDWRTSKLQLASRLGDLNIKNIDSE